MRLGAILDEGQAVGIADPLDGVDRRGLAIEMDGDDRLGFLRDFLLDLGGIDMEIFVDIHEYGPGAGLGDRFGR